MAPALTSQWSSQGLYRSYREGAAEGMKLDKVVVCLYKALKVEFLEAQLADEALTTRSRKGETTLAFAQRLRPLL